mmetsp:Transcript_44198/g.102087  ORF Transcript_44198/g.102087 Transcript_44198/m.102087 type:complete len:258 (+) Transcript_44198:1-774(+)
MQQRTLLQQHSPQHSAQVAKRPGGSSTARRQLHSVGSALWSHLAVAFVAKLLRPLDPSLPLDAAALLLLERCPSALAVCLNLLGHALSVDDLRLLPHCLSTGHRAAGEAERRTASSSHSLEHALEAPKAAAEVAAKATTAKAAAEAAEVEAKTVPAPLALFELVESPLQLQQRGGMLGFFVLPLQALQHLVLLATPLRQLKHFLYLLRPSLVGLPHLLVEGAHRLLQLRQGIASITAAGHVLNLDVFEELTKVCERV